MIKDIAFTVYAVSDMARARQFYENVLGLTPGELTGEHWFEYAVGDNTFGLGCFPEDVAGYYKNGSAVVFDVEDLDTALEKMKQHDVPILSGPIDFPKCRMLLISDPDNNVITLHQFKK
jgi:predicted enzyme related to lactoylglutathione lyase